MFLLREGGKLKSIVLLSSGLDSAVNLLMAIRRTKALLSLTFDYGQKAREKEVYYSRELCKKYKVSHEVIHLGFLEKINKSALGKKGEVPFLTENDFLQEKAVKESARAVWVPNRNGLFLNIAACFAESIGADLIVAGFNREEAQTFPDNSPQFLTVANKFFKYSTLGKLKAISYTQDLSKKEIVKVGIELGLPFELIWSCYQGEELMCGKCESCLRLLRAVRGTSVYSVVKERMKNA
jgi:7-cyano-7-deazaguanine synthase